MIQAISYFYALPQAAFCRYITAFQWALVAEWYKQPNGVANPASVTLGRFPAVQLTNRGKQS